MAPSFAPAGLHWAKRLWKSRQEGGRAGRRRTRRHRAGELRPETLEPRALLAVTAGLTGSELLIDLGEANDTAILQVEGGSYAVREGAQTVGSFSMAAVNSIRVTGDAAKPGQMLFIKPGGVVADSLTVAGGVEATVVNAPIVTPGAVSIESAAITLAENVSSAGSQFYGGTVRLSNDIVLDAGASQIRFGSQIRSTVGPRATLMEDLGAPNRLAVAPGGGVIYASDAVSNYVYFIDLAAQQLDTVDLGKSMGHVALSPNGSRLYVANPLDGSVSVVDTTSRAAVATIAVPGTPEGMAFSPDGQTLYVANYSENSVAVINAGTNRLTRTIPVDGSPTAVAVAADGRLWVASELLNRVSVVDAATAAIEAEIPVGRGPADITLSADGSRAYVANNFDGTVSAIDTATATVLATIGVGSGPTELAATPDGRLVYVVNGFSDSVSVIDTASLSVATTTSVGSLPVGLALSADGRTAYVANLNSLSELGNDPRSLTVRTTGTVRFDAVASEVDPLRQLIVEAGRRIGPLTPLESAGIVTLARDENGNLWANDTPITDSSGNPLNYQAMVRSGWTPVAADVDGGKNTLVLEHSSRALFFWRFDSSWKHVSGDSWTALESLAYFTAEERFQTDFNRDGVIGLGLTTIESGGSVRLSRDVLGRLWANGTMITSNGAVMRVQNLVNSGWTPVAADVDGGRNTLVLRYSTGHLTFLRFDAGWRQTSGGGGWIAPDTNAFFGRELAFDADLNGDGVVTIEVAGDITLAYDAQTGDLRADGSPIVFNGSALNYRSLVTGGWQPMAAEVDRGVNTVVLRESAGGNLRFWRMDADWKQVSGDGWVAPRSPQFFETEVTFGVDLDGDGGVMIETAGNVVFSYDGEGNLRANGVLVTDQGAAMNYHDMVAVGWRPMAADVADDGRNTVVLQSSVGRIRYWRFDTGWTRQSADGWVPIGSQEFFVAEATFGADLDGDGSRTIEAAGSTIMTIDRVGRLRAHAVSGGTVDVAGNGIISGGQPANYYSMVSTGWTAKAAELHEGKNTVLLEHSSGFLRFWRLDATWNQVSGDGWVATNSQAALGIETAFGVDLNGDGRIGA
jgi:YVTN family beta-propeller protein